MRITSQMVYRNTARTLMKRQVAIDQIRRQMNSGVKNERPSDDPQAFIMASRLSSLKSAVETARRDTALAITYLGPAEQYLANLQDMMSEAYGLAIQAGNPALQPGDIATISQRVEQLGRLALDQINARVGDRYLFSGSKTDTKPFVLTGTTVTYHGDDHVSTAKVDVHLDMPVSTPGTDLIAINPVQIMMELAADLAAGDVSQLDQHVADLHSAIAGISNVRSELGARYAAFESAQLTLDQQRIYLDEWINADVSINMAEAATELMAEQTAYEASLAMAAKINAQSLLNYL